MVLDDKIIDVLVERIVNRVEKGNTFILEQIGKTIKNIGSLNATSVHQLSKILKYGSNYDKIVQELAKITNLNIQDIIDIFNAVAKENYIFAKQFYDYRGIEYIPYEQNLALKRQVRAIAELTVGEYINLSKTTGFATKDIYGNLQYTPLAQMYQQVIDEATLLVSQGKVDFNKGMYKTVKELGNSGIRVISYASGYHRRADSAIRMNLKDALRDMSITLQKQFGEEFGADGIEVSHHTNSAPDHIDSVDGKQFTIDECNNINDSLKRHVGELNCYHYVFPIILGVSKPNYTKEEIQADKEKNIKGCEIDGKHYTLYEASQLQRRLETEIRRNKDKQIIGVASGNKEIVQEAQRRITQLTNKYREVSKISGLPTKLERARVIGYKRKDINKM